MLLVEGFALLLQFADTSACLRQYRQVGSKTCLTHTLIVVDLPSINGASWSARVRKAKRS